MKKSIFIIILSFSAVIFAQPKTADKILKEVVDKFERIKDYTVDVQIKIDFSMVKVPDTKATIYFKQPDKVKVDSKGFAMLPKQSTNFSPMQFIQGDYTAIYVKSELSGGNSLDVVKIIPNSDSSDVILSTLWIDQDQKVIRKIETTGKSSGTLHVELSYENKNQGLPSQVVFSFNLGNMDIPENATDGKDDSNREKGPGRRNLKMSGKVYMTYTGYKINTGLPDSLFEQKNKGEK